MWLCVSVTESWGCPGLQGSGHRTVRRGARGERWPLTTYVTSIRQKWDRNVHCVTVYSFTSGRLLLDTSLVFPVLVQCIPDLCLERLPCDLFVSYAHAPHRADRPVSSSHPMHFIQLFDVKQMSDLSDIKEWLFFHGNLAQKGEVRILDFNLIST